MSGHLTNHRFYLLIRSFLVFLFLALLTYLSLATHPLGGNNPWILNFKGSDKVAHFTLYCIFCLTVTWAYYPYIKKRKVFLLIFLSIILYGIFMEICQGWIFPVGRSFELLDIAANITGVAIAAFCYNLFRRIL